MAITFEVKKNLEVRKKFVVDGKEYDNIDEVPEQYRGAIESALASRGPATVIQFNGKPIEGTEQLPAPLRLIVGGLADMAAKQAEAQAGAEARNDIPRWSRSDAVLPEAVRPEPIIGARTILVVIVLTALAFWFLGAAR
jgi:hypothetical protein